jgi:hypothetical protein
LQWKAGRLDEAPEWIAEPYGLQIAGDLVAAAARWLERACPYVAARALAESNIAGDVTNALAEFNDSAQHPPHGRRERLRALGAPILAAPADDAREPRADDVA